MGEDDVDRWRRTVEVNLIGLYLVTRAFLPHISADGGGKIINIGSGMGHAPVPGNSSYAVAKAGVWMFTQVLAREVWEQDVEVNEGRARAGGHAPDGRPDARRRPAAVRSERAGLRRPQRWLIWCCGWRRGRRVVRPAQSFSLARRPL